MLYVVQAAILCVLMRAQWEYRPARYWAAGALGTALGAILIGLRSEVGATLSIVFGNLVLSGGTALTCCGVIAACGRRPPWRLALLWWGLAVVLGAWFYWAHASLQMRIALYHLFNAGVLLAETAALLDSRSGPVGTARWLIATGGLLALASGAIRAVSGLHSIDEPSWANLAFIVAGLVRCFTQTAGCIMMVGENYRRELERVSRLDPLTGLANRRGFDEIAARIWAQARRQQWPVAALMIDIDHFKSINDRFGHQAGDEVLSRIGRMLRHGLREDDLVGRYGGEEFAAILPNTDLEQAARLGERLRQAGATLVLPDGSVPTLSVGVAITIPAASPWQSLLDRADRALYRAKSDGRDRVMTWVADTEEAMTK